MNTLLLLFFWRKSEAHKLLLSKFMRPRELNTLKPEQWAPVLNESLKRAVARFIKKGIIFQDEQGLYRCSEIGMLMATPYIEKTKAEYEKLTSDLISFLESGNYAKAAKLRAAYNAKQVFQSGINVNWKKYDYARRDKSFLKAIFGKPPTVLNNAKKLALKKAQIAAAISFLTENRIAQKYLKDAMPVGNFSSGDASRMIFSHASYLKRLQEVKNIGICKGISIMTIDDSFTCQACKTASKKTYKTKNVPELPMKDCTCEHGCRCFIVPVF